MKRHCAECSDCFLTESVVGARPGNSSSIFSRRRLVPSSESKSSGRNGRLFVCRPAMIGIDHAVFDGKTVRGWSFVNTASKRLGNSVKPCSRILAGMCA